MKLIFLYGLPGVGKLTVANEIAHRTGYKNFHCHLTVDLGKAIFDQGSRPYVELVNHMREYVIEKAMTENVPGLLFTFAFGKSDEIWALKVADLVERNNGEIFFVHLHASRAVLMERVVQEERRRYRKIRDPKLLDEILREYDFDMRVNHRNHLSIDNTTLSPDDVATRIIEHFSM